MYFETYGPEDDLYQTFYPAISFHLHKGQVPNDYGSSEHQWAIWCRCRDAAIFSTKGGKATPGRWYDIWDRSLPMQEWDGANMMILACIGLYHGFYRSLADIPGARAACIAEEEGEAPVVPEARLSALAEGRAVDNSAAGDRTVRNSDREVENLRKAFRNTMHLAGVIFANSELRSLWMIVGAIVEVSKYEHRQKVTRLNTQWSASDWHSDMASASFNSYLKKSAKVFGDGDLFIAAGLARYSNMTPFWMLQDRDAAIKIGNKALEF